MPLLPHFAAKSSWDYENGFYLTSPPSRLGKTLNQYELYKRVVDLPGEVLEFGVYKGASIAKLLAFRGILEVEHSRKIIGFDAFGKFPQTGVDSSGDRDFIERFEGEGGDGFDCSEIDHYLQLKGFGNYELIAGDVRNTLPDLLETRPELRVALLHLDLDVYEPTVEVLRLLETRLVVGALVMVDDYASVGGASLAIDEFVERHQLRVEKLSMSHNPSFITWPGKRAAATS